MEDADLRERVEHLGRFAEARSNALMEENAKLKEELENRRWTDVNARMFTRELLNFPLKFAIATLKIMIRNSPLC